MPCDYDGPCKDHSKPLRRVTRVARDMRTILRRHGLEHELCQETQTWIGEHDQADARRIAEENANGVRAAAKKSGLAKLSLEERRALGL